MYASITLLAKFLLRCSTYLTLFAMNFFIVLTKVNNIIIKVFVSGAEVAIRNGDTEKQFLQRNNPTFLYIKKFLSTLPSISVLNFF